MAHDPIVVEVVDGETITITPGVTQVASVAVTDAEPVVVAVADGDPVEVAVTNAAPIQVDVTALGAPGVGLREVYLDDEVVPAGVPAWLRITRDGTGAVTGIYYGRP